MDDLKKLIRDVPDFPKPGIVFRDITTLLLDSDALRRVIDALTDYYRDKNIDSIIAVESRGFIFGSVLAYCLGTGFVLARKPGKLPADTVKEVYDLEYGQDTIEVHADSIKPGHRVLVIDDLLATGGTARAGGNLVKKLGGEIASYAFVIELGDLDGRGKLDDAPIFSLITY